LPQEESLLAPGDSRSGPSPRSSGFGRAGGSRPPGAGKANEQLY